MTTIYGSTINYGSSTNGSILVYGSILVQNHTITELSQKRDHNTLANTELIRDNHLKHQKQIIADNRVILTNRE